MKEFGKLLIFATFLALLLHISAVINAQTVDKHNEQQSVASLNISSASDGPVAVVKSSAPRKVSNLILEINNLTNGDDALTEKVIAVLCKHRQVPVDRIVSDEEYERLPEKDKAVCVKQSEINEILKQLK